MRVWVQPRSRRDVEFCASRWLSLLVRPRVPFVHGRSVGQSIIRVIRSIGQSVNRSDGESVGLSSVRCLRCVESVARAETDAEIQSALKVGG